MHPEVYERIARLFEDFQFSIWDASSALPTMLWEPLSEPFNSLFEMQYQIIALAVPCIYRCLSILYLRCSARHIAGGVQKEGLSILYLRCWVSTVAQLFRCCQVSFNSLFEMLSRALSIVVGVVVGPFQFSIWDAMRHGYICAFSNIKPFNSLFEMPMKYGAGIGALGLIFQFSIWDAGSGTNWKPPGHDGGIYFQFSIWDVGGIPADVILDAKAFNSLFEMQTYRSARPS